MLFNGKIVSANMAFLPIDTENVIEDVLKACDKEYAGSIVETKSGEVITATDSAERQLQGLTLYGKTTQNSTTGKNLFKPENVVNGFPYDGTGDFTMNTARRTVYILCDPNTAYTVSKKNGKCFAVGYTQFFPAEGVTVDGFISDSSKTSLTITTGADAVYLIAWVYNADADTCTAAEMLETVQIEKGTTATAYEPYTGGIPAPNPEYPQTLESVGESIGVTVCGKNLLPFPYADGTKTHNGITYTVNADGSITANGTATANSDFNLCLSNYPFQLKEGEQYIYSGCPKGGSNTTYRIRLQDNTYYQTENDTGDGIAFTARYENYYAWIDIKAGTTLNNLTFYPMIRLASTGAEYEPYKEQTMTATAEGGLHGIGEVKDEVDFARGVLIRRIGTVVFDGSSDEPWNYGNNYIDYPNNETLYVRLWAYLSDFGFASKAYVLSDKLGVHYTQGEGGSYQPKYGAEMWTGLTHFNFVPGKEFLYSANSLATMRQWLAENPITVLYELAEPVETPLSADELSAFAELHSNKPNTTAFNDSGAEMKLDYVADTKAYIDNKFNELALAILNNA